MKCAVFPCLGLGDGLIASILPHHLCLAGHQVDTFHPLMGQLQPLFPNLRFFPRSQDTAILAEYDRLYFFYEKLEWMQSFIKAAQEKFPDKIVILNPIATPNRDYPYWEVGRFDGRVPFAYNLATYCRHHLEIQGTLANGLKIPEGITSRKHLNRVILHPTSSRLDKNWSPHKFVQLAEKLKGEGFEPVFILTESEKAEWPKADAPAFANLYEVALFVAESGWMIGNDSGIGHLASVLGIPTLTICRSKFRADFWRPAWQEGRVIVPPAWILNIKGMRWRDKKWQMFIPVQKVYKEFLSLRSTSAT